MLSKTRYSPVALPLVGAALWLVLSSGLPAQITTTVLPQGSVPADPIIKRKGEILLLINQAKEELLFNRPAEAKLKCEQVLAIDPENPDARFILAQAERQLKNAVSGRRTAISSLPDASKIQEAVERSRPTTSVVVLPSDRMSSPPAVRSAVADPREGIAPRPAPVWLSQKYLVGAAVVLMAILGFVLAMLIWERFTSGKRHRAAQAQLFEHMRAMAARGESISAGGFEVPEGFSRLAADDDFPVGVSAPSSPPAASAPPPHSASTAPPKSKAAAGAEDELMDIWGAPGGGKPAALRPGTIAPAHQAPAPAAPPEEEQELIPAASIFGDEIAPRAPVVPPQPAPAAPPQSVPPPPSPAPVAAVTPEEDEGPIPLEDILARSTGLPGYREAEEESSESAPELRTDSFPLEEMDIKSDSPQARIEEVPFTLDTSFDQTLLDEEQEEPVSKPVLPSPEEAEKPEEVGTIRLEDDFPLGTGEIPAADRPVGPEPLSAAGGDFIPPASPQTAPDVVEEVLFAPGASFSPSAVEPSPGLDKTVVDEQARQKALFQDQLARGLAAMERGDWSEAVKFFSVAHAMDPADPFAQKKLREAREKKDKR